MLHTLPPFWSLVLALSKMLGPAAGALGVLLSWGSSLGPRVTLKCFLFVFVFRGIAVCHIVYLLEEGKQLCLFTLEKYLLYPYFHPPLVLSPLVNVISSAFVPREQLRGN